MRRIKVREVLIARTFLGTACLVCASLLSCNLFASAPQILVSHSPFPQLTSSPLKISTKSLVQTSTTTRMPTNISTLTRMDTRTPNPKTILATEPVDSPLGLATIVPPSLTPGPDQITYGLDVWNLVSVDFPSYITALGRVYSPPTRRDPFPAYVFIRLNFECTTGKSLIDLYSGLVMGLNFVHKQSGYPDLSIEDLQGHKYLVTLLGACWLAAPMPRTRVKDAYFTLNFKDLPPLTFSSEANLMQSQEDICFISDMYGTDEVYSANSDGENLLRLTTNFSRAAEPSWSNDHQEIAYVSYKNGNGDISIISRTGVELAELDISSADEGGPVWAPLDKRIAFHTLRDGNWEVYSSSTSGTDLINLSRSSFDDMYPTWSPDGKQLAFQKLREGDWEIYLMNSDGTQSEQLTNNETDEILPTWSPDGYQILFWSFQSGTWKLMSINPDGQNLSTLTHTKILAQIQTAQRGLQMGEKSFFLSIGKDSCNSIR